MTLVDSNEKYFEGQNVFLAEYSKPNELVACLAENPDYHIIDRITR
jgi:hypothetical protein